MIKLFSPYVPQETASEIAKILGSGHLAQGPKVDEFEKKFSNLFKVDYPVSVNSGTAALEIAYELANLGPGDEVITTPLTCSATNIPLLRRGVKIVWADIKEDTLCIDPADVIDKITDKTKAIVQVHLGGVFAELGDWFHANPADPIYVISDACQALGIFSGDYTCCSFQAIKHVTTGDGGMLVLNNKDEYEKAKLMRWFGIDRTKKIENNWESYRTRMMCFDIEVLGMKRQMNDIAATMGIVGLDHYIEVLEYRKNLFNIYKEELKDIGGIRLIDGKTNTYWLVTALVDDRDEFAKSLYDSGIETNVVQVRNDKYKIFGGKVELPVLDKIDSKYLSLPIGMHTTEDDIRYICDIIRKGW